jgi:hypothetical protein
MPNALAATTYADDYLIDVKFGIIMDVEASRAIRQPEVGAATTMIERTEECFRIKPERFSADTRMVQPCANSCHSLPGSADHRRP